MLLRSLLAISALALFSGCATTPRPSAAELTEKAASYDWPDPVARYESAIIAFEEEGPQPTGAIVGIGSSSMRGWHGMINEDLAPLTIIPRGFGGSNMYDALYFVDRAVIAHEPRAVILYEGDNDIAMGKPPEAVLDTFRAFVARIHEADPTVRIYVLAVKPSISRVGVWPQMQATNELLRAECETDRRLFFIDVATPMLDEEGNMREELYLGDMLHMNRAGYEVWRDAVRPVIVPIEAPFE
ncbi:MAG: hypothetical protein JJU11_06280 [Candidatus Sumerlaeia bacterium]|nr:hypothetical protein [Candidatus Sumerlaeia bacterium]